jgi:hypothetical protein
MRSAEDAAAVIDAWSRDQAASDAAYAETLRSNRMPIHGSGMECGIQPALVLKLGGRLI